MEEMKEWNIWKSSTEDKLSFSNKSSERVGKYYSSDYFIEMNNIHNSLNHHQGFDHNIA